MYSFILFWKLAYLSSSLQEQNTKIKYQNNVVYCKQSVNPSTREAIAGGLIRDYLGRCYFAFSSNLGSCSIARAELHGIATSLRLAWDVGFRSVLVQSDSQTALALVLDEGPPQHQHTNEVLTIRELMNRDWVVNLSHVFREANQAADFLASIEYNCQLGTHLISTSDCNLAFFLRQDCMGNSTPRLIPI
ncbi:Putative ribonuclease H protein At1g65750 [Linum perenne]